MRSCLSFAIAAAAALAGCATPDTAYRGIPAVRMDMGGSLFDIRVKGRRAEAIRRNPQWAPRLASVGVPAVLAIEAVSGCRVARLTGDQARMQATLDCGVGPPPPLPGAGELFCEIDTHGDGETASGYCVPVDESWPRPG